MEGWTWNTHTPDCPSDKYPFVLHLVCSRRDFRAHCCSTRLLSPTLTTSYTLLTIDHDVRTHSAPSRHYSTFVSECTPSSTR